MTRHALVAGTSIAIALAALLLSVAAPTVAHAAPPPVPGDGVFMSDWLILGGIPIFDGEPDTADYATIAGAIDRDFLSEAGGEGAAAPTEGDTLTIADTEYTWTAGASEDDTVDLALICGDLSFAVAYAYVEFTESQARSVTLGIGTDDDGKMWVNGEDVYTHRGGRGVTLDDDTVAVELVQGVNRILIKVVNQEVSWGFVGRIMDAKALGELLFDAAREGRMDDVRAYSAQGADLTATRNGLTAAQTARMRGYRDVAEALVSAGAAATDPMPSPEDVLDALLTQIVGEGMPGAAVLVARDGEALFERGYGLADVDAGVSITPDTKFRIGSITKQFTAAAILRLQEEGKLSVTDTLDTFLPDYPRGVEVTLHHLLTHTSGIHNYTANEGFIDLATVPIDAADHIASFQADPYDFDPGAGWYSNSGYYLLGYIVELVSEQSLYAHLREQFFDPLGMADTGVSDTPMTADNEALGYTYVDGAVESASNWDVSRTYGAGALYSTVRDLNRWNNAVFSYEVLSEETMQAALTPARLNDGSEANAMGGGYGYGYGWMIGESRGVTVISHGGGLSGFLSHLLWIPEKRMTVSVLHNAMAPIPGMNPGALGPASAEVFLWEELPARASISAADIDPSVFDRFAGHYLLAGMAKLDIRRVGDDIQVLAGGTSTTLIPTSETELLVPGTAVILRFVLDEAGDLLRMERDEGGSILEAYPVEEEQEVAVSLDILEQYVGQYDYPGDMVLTVSIRDGRLFAQATGQPGFPIFARSDTEFFWKVVEASAVFVRGESGAVEEVIHRQGPNVIHAARIE